MGQPGTAYEYHLVEDVSTDQVEHAFAQLDHQPGQGEEQDAGDQGDYAQHYLWYQSLGIR